MKRMILLILLCVMPVIALVFTVKVNAENQTTFIPIITRTVVPTSTPAGTRIPAVTLTPDETPTPDTRTACTLEDAYYEPEDHIRIILTSSGRPVYAIALIYYADDDSIGIILGELNDEYFTPEFGIAYDDAPAEGELITLEGTLTQEGDFLSVTIGRCGDDFRFEYELTQVTGGVPAKPTIIPKP